MTQNDQYTGGRDRSGGWLDVTVVLGGIAVWFHGAKTGNPMGVNVGFLAITAVVASRRGWI